MQINQTAKFDNLTQFTSQFDNLTLFTPAARRVSSPDKHHEINFSPSYLSDPNYSRLDLYKGQSLHWGLGTYDLKFDQTALEFS